MRPIRVTDGELDTVLRSNTTQLVPQAHWPQFAQEIPNVVQLWSWTQVSSAQTIRSDGTTISGVFGTVETIRQTTQTSPAWKQDRWYYYRTADGAAYRVGPFRGGVEHHTDRLDAWPLQRPGAPKP